jgi:methyl-accepting chemotaxis protein
MVDSSSHIRSELQEALQAMTSTLRETMEAVSHQLSDTSKNAAAEIGGSLSGFERGVAQLEQTTEAHSQLLPRFELILERVDSLGRTLGDANRDLQATVQPLREVAEGFRESASRVAEAVQRTDTVASRMQGAAESLESHQREIAAAWESYRTRFEDIDRSLRDAFQQIDQGLNRYTDQVRTFAQDLDNHTGSAIDKLGAFIHELNETVEALLESNGRSRA